MGKLGIIGWWRRARVGARPGGVRRRRRTTRSSSSIRACRRSGARSRTSTSAARTSSPTWSETVKGAAAFEKETFTAVTEARSRVGQVSGAAGAKTAGDPAQLAQFQEAQDGLSAALSRLLVVVERYPDLKATANFRDLQAQLEGTENRIAVERMRFNEAAQAFNTRRQSFPTVVVAGSVRRPLP